MRRLDPIALAIIVTAGFLRCFDLGRRSLWFDEAWAAIGLLDGPFDIAHVRTTPLVFAAMVRASAAVFGRNEIAVRLPAMLFSTAAVILAWLVARRLVGRRGGWLAAVIVGLLPIPMYYGKEMKVYGVELCVALAVAALTGVVRAAPGTRLGWAAIALVAGLGPGLTPIVPLLITGALLVLLPVARGAPSAWIATALVGAAATLTWYFLVFTAQVAMEGTIRAYWWQFYLPHRPIAAVPAAVVRSVLEAATFGLGPALPHHADNVHRIATVPPTVMYVVGTALALGAAYLVRTGGGWFVQLTLAWHALVAGAAFAGQYPYGPARIALFFLGPTAILLGAAAAALAAVVPRAVRSGVWLVAFVPLLWPLAGTWRENWRTPFEREELRPVLEYVFAHLESDDVVWVGRGAAYAFRFYVPTPDRRFTVAGPFDAPATLDAAARRARARLWLVFGHGAVKERASAFRTLGRFQVLDSVSKTGAAAVLVSPEKD